MEVNEKTLMRLVEMTEDNNRLLHKMRRGAIWGGVIKFVLYALVFVVGPLWLYATYLAPIINSMNATMQQMQGTGAKVQTQFSDFQNFMKNLKQPFSSGQ